MALPKFSVIPIQDADTKDSYVSILVMDFATGLGVTTVLTFEDAELLQQAISVALRLLAPATSNEQN